VIAAIGDYTVFPGHRGAPSAAPRSAALDRADATVGTNTTQLATTAFVLQSGVASVFGRTGQLSPAAVTTP